jgi:hypothetical protein
MRLEGFRACIDRMPRIKKLVLRDPVGVPSSCCITTSERIGHWAKTRRFLARFSGPEASGHSRYLVDFTITTSEFRFSVHTSSDGKAVVDG